VKQNERGLEWCGGVLAVYMVDIIEKFFGVIEYMEGIIVFMYLVQVFKAVYKKG